MYYASFDPLAIKEHNGGVLKEVSKLLLEKRLRDNRQPRSGRPFALAMRAGAHGYVLKEGDEEEMVLSIRAVGRGEAIVSPAVATRGLAYFSKPAVLPQVFPTLTGREREILNLIA